MPPTSAPGCSTQYKTDGRSATRWDRSASKTMLMLPPTPHLPLQRQGDLPRGLAAAAIGADDVAGVDVVLVAAQPIPHVHGDAVVVLLQGQVLGVEPHLRAP